MLEELQKSNPDSAITAALNKLSIDEKAREAKATAQFSTLPLLSCSTILVR